MDTLEALIWDYVHRNAQKLAETMPDGTLFTLAFAMQEQMEKREKSQSGPFSAFMMALRLLRDQQMKASLNTPHP